jgi:hypothetical protein
MALVRLKKKKQKQKDDAAQYTNAGEKILPEPSLGTGVRRRV